MSLFSSSKKSTKVTNVSETTNNNLNQQNQGDAYSIAGIQTEGGSVTLGDYGAIDKAFEISRNAGAAIQESLQAMAALASDSVDGGLAAAKSQESALATQGRLAGYAKIAAALAAVLGALLALFLILKKLF